MLVVNWVSRSNWGASRHPRQGLSVASRLMAGLSSGDESAAYDRGLASASPPRLDPAHGSHSICQGQTALVTGASRWSHRVRAILALPGGLDGAEVVVSNYAIPFQRSLRPVVPE